MALKLKQFGAEHQSSRLKLSSITISPVGRIALSDLALQETGLKIGDRISLFQDENEPTDWYFGKHEDGIPLAEAKGGEATIQAKVIANEVLNSLDQQTTCRFSIGVTDQKIEKNKLWSIFTRKPLLIRKSKK